LASKTRESPSTATKLINSMSRFSFQKQSHSATFLKKTTILQKYKKKKTIMMPVFRLKLIKKKKQLLF
jgi:hypothetical protein